MWEETIPHFSTFGKNYASRFDGTKPLVGMDEFEKISDMETSKWATT